MTLLSGFTISDSLSSPIPPTSVGDIVDAINSNDISSSASQLITIAKAASSASYELQIPTEDTAEWVIGYSCETSATPVECGKYIRTGYFNSGVVNTMTVPSFAGAEFLPGGQSYAGIDFSIIKR